MNKKKILVIMFFGAFVLGGSTINMHLLKEVDLTAEVSLNQLISQSYADGESGGFDYCASRETTEKTFADEPCGIFKSVLTLAGGCYGTNGSCLQGSVTFLYFHDDNCWVYGGQVIGSFTESDC